MYLVGSAMPQLSEASGDPVLAEYPIWDRLRKSSSKFPQSLAIACLHQSASLYDISSTSSKYDYLRWSYSDLTKAVDIFADNLTYLGARPGAVLATFLDNGAEFVVTCWAAHKLGCPFVPLNPKILNNHNHAEHMLTTSGATIVILQDVKHGEIVEKMRVRGLSMGVKIFVSGRAPNTSWTSFSTIMGKRFTDYTLRMDEGKRSTEEAVTVLFTSGTTSVPKAVLHTSTTLNSFCRNLSLSGTSQTSIFCSVLPNNHAMGYFFPLHYMMHGAAIVYPSPVFNATAMVNALEAEKVTHTAIVPTGLYALLEAIEVREVPFESSLEDVCLSGSCVTPENIHQIFDRLGSKGASTGFGMTEGSPIWSPSQKCPEDLIVDNFVIAGTVSPGARVRICAPYSRKPLPQGEPGEIHQSGPGAIKSYSGHAGKDSFYEDEQGRVWFITGDQGVMHADGRFSITGRYKDMINRGGENISPAAVEAVIFRHCNVQGYVVGVPDSIAGEVPVLVLPESQSVDSAAIQNAVLRHLGAPFVPERIFTPAQLGIADIPITSSIKVQKSQLVALVSAWMSNDEAQKNDHFEISVKDHVLTAYFKATGIPIDKLDVNEDTNQFADSITFMRVRDYLRKSLGRTLTISEMMDDPTISSQVKVLQDRAPTSNQKVIEPDVTHTQPCPTSDELTVLFGGAKESHRMTAKISEILEVGGLSWSQVSSIIPAHDYMQVLLDSRIIDTWHFAIAITMSGSSVTDLRIALQKTLPFHPVLTSFVVNDNQQGAHYITLQASSKLWNTCIFDHGSVDTAEDIQRLAVSFPRTELSRMPGPLSSYLLVNVRETNSAAMIVYIHHMVQDVSSFRLFLADLDQMLSTPSKELVPHTDFKAWADSYNALRLSPEATTSVNFHVRRLQNLHKHQGGLYPPARVPRQANSDVPDGLDHSFDVPGLTRLRQHTEVTAAVVLKAAMALVNVSRTAHSHAIFCNFEAGRMQFPFVPKTMRMLDPDAFEAADVNGPVMQGVCNLIEVPRSEAAITLLKRVQRDQDGLTKHAHAPLRRIIEGLNAEERAAGDMIVEAHRTQFCTWVPGLLGEYDRLQVAKIAIRNSQGLTIVGGLGGPTATTYMLSLRWDVANYSRGQTNEFVRDLESAVLWLCEIENWERPVRDFIGTCTGVYEMAEKEHGEFPAESV